MEVHYPGQVPVTAQPQAPQVGIFQATPMINNTTVIMQQPVISQNLPRPWSSGICSCFEDCSSCMLAMCCPLALECQVASRMGESACLPCCVPNFLIVLRTKLRTEHNIQGSVMDDCCMAICCGPCALCQLSRELDYVRNMPR